MALINQNDLFDRLQEYIDKKIGEMPDGIRQVFEDYDIQQIIDVIIPNIDEILGSKEWSDCAKNFANAPEDSVINCSDGTNGYSAYHWAKKAEEQRLNTYDKNEFIANSTGAPDAGKPIVLGGTGKISNTMLDIGSTDYQSTFMPQAGSEYPDTTGTSTGAYWIVNGLTADYTFTGGDLAGQTATNGDYMIINSTGGFDLIDNDVDVGLYYLVDGTNAITAPFAGGGQQIKNIADGTDDTDAVTKRQLDEKAGRDSETFTNTTVNGVYPDATGSGDEFLSNDGTYRSVPGVKQRQWVDETSNRAFGVEYTNDTGYEMEVSVHAGHSNDGDYGVALGCYVDGIYLGRSFTVDYGIVRETFTVPAGSTYKVTIWQHDGSYAERTWCELKVIN